MDERTGCLQGRASLETVANLRRILVVIPFDLSQQTLANETRKEGAEDIPCY